MRQLYEKVNVLLQLVEGEFIAIYQVENSGKTDAEILAADLVHEMFHAYQMRSGEDYWPDDFKLLAYPENIENYRLKYAENQLLADAYGETGSRRAGMLAAFRAIREQRRKLAGEYLEQELRTEHIEGRAEYAGCRALQFINPHKFQERMGRYLCALRNMDQTFLTSGGRHILQGQCTTWLARTVVRKSLYRQSFGVISRSGQSG